MNVLKITAYISGVWSAAIVLAASYYSTTLTPYALLICLVVGWGGFIFVAAVVYACWRRKYLAPRTDVKDRLLANAAFGAAPSQL